jgi:hypothetical protein
MPSPPANVNRGQKCPFLRPLTPDGQSIDLAPRRSPATIPGLAFPIRAARNRGAGAWWPGRDNNHYEYADIIYTYWHCRSGGDFCKKIRECDDFPEVGVVVDFIQAYRLLQLVM